MKIQIEEQLMNVSREEELVCRDCGCCFTADEISSEDEDGNDLCPSCESKHISMLI